MFEPRIAAFFLLPSLVPDLLGNLVANLHGLHISRPKSTDIVGFPKNRNFVVNVGPERVMIPLLRPERDARHEPWIDQ